MWCNPEGVLPKYGSLVLKHSLHFYENRSVHEIITKNTAQRAREALNFQLDVVAFKRIVLNLECKVH